MAQKTFAQRALAIQKRYPYADRVKADKEAMYSELLALFEEQEAYKMDNQIESPSDGSFGNAGLSYGKNRDPRLGFYGMYTTTDEIDSDPLVKRSDLPFGERLLKSDFDIKKRGLPFGDDVLNVNFDPNATSDPEPEERNYGKESSLMNILAGAVPAVGNLTNLLSVPSTRKLSPTLINPTFSFQETDLTPYMTALDNQMASNKYSLMESGADFDTITAGLNTLASKYATGRGQITLEQARLNQEEAKRGDAIFNRAGELNTAATNAFKMDYENRRRVDEQVKRDYLAGLSESISAIFQDEADRLLALELGPTMGAIETFSNILKTT